MYTRKERPVFQNAAADDELSNASWIGDPQFRANFEDGFRLCGEVKGIFCFVVINSLQSVTVIEEYGRPAGAVGYQTMKTAIQSFGKIRFLLISMNQVGWPIRGYLVPGCPKRLNRAGLWELFT